jgi:hypothetical protein
MNELPIKPDKFPEILSFSAMGGLSLSLSFSFSYYY